MPTKRTKKTLGRAGVGIAVVAVVAVGLLGYKAAAGTSNPNHYRTVTAGAGTVTQILALSGTVHHVTQSSVSFPTSGTVTAVNVKAGDTVAAGQALASINATPLQNAVLAADAAYKSAISQYQTDQDTYASSTTSSSTTKAATTSTSRATTGTSSSQPSSGAPSGTGTPSGGGTGGPGGTGGGGGATDPTAAVKAATDAIAALQAGVTTVETQLPIFVTDCVPLIPTTTASPTAAATTITETATVYVTVTETPSASVTGAAVTAASATKAASSAASSATTSAKPKTSTTSAPNVSAKAVISTTCQAAIEALTATSATLPGQMTAANVALNAAVKALDAEAASLTQQAAALKQQQAALAAELAKQAAAAKQQSASLTGTNSALQAAAAAGLSRSGGNGTVTAATLITDQSTIETTHIALASAQDQLNQATITSPIAGKVASMPFVVGQQASATASAVIIGSGAIEVTVPVPLAKRAQVATGQAATVTSTIGGTTLKGTISRIALLPTTTSTFAAAAAAAGSSSSSSSSSQSTTTYATVITIATGGDALPETSRVAATITTKTVDAAVVLPASAVTPTGTGSGTVQVVTNGILSTKRVVTGALGDTEIQIVSGVSAGESVVIADVDKAIPGASIAASRASTNAQQQQPQDFPTGGGAGGGPAGGPGGPPT